MSKTIIYQHDIHGNPKPYSEEDKELSKSFMPNQIVKHVVSGVTKPRSLAQLRTYWACCKYVSDNIREDDFDKRFWSNKDLVDRQIRAALHFIDPDKTIVRGQEVIVCYRSISFENLHHIESFGYFDPAFELLAKKIGLDKETLVENVKRQMGV